MIGFIIFEWYNAWWMFMFYKRNVSKDVVEINFETKIFYYINS